MNSGDLQRWAAIAAAVVLAAVFVVAAVSKLAAPASWLAQARGLGVPRPVAAAVPVVEAVVGAWLLVQWQRAAAAAAAAGLIAAFTLLVALRLAQGQRPPCACFGSLSARPLGPAVLVRNGLLLALAAIAMA